MLVVLVLVAYATFSLASYGSNLNYRSPSLRHPSLGLSVPKIARRQANLATDAANLRFTHGVASGDPHTSSVILWTRCAPISDDVQDDHPVSGGVPYFNPVPIYGDHTAAPSSAPICVQYAIARDRKLSRVVHSGKAFTSSDVDYTLKVEATGLAPFTQYFYQFRVCESKISSPVGRTKTVPVSGADYASKIGIAVYSCNNYPYGYFNAYAGSVRRDSVDYVVHLGDYIYEYSPPGYGSDIGRTTSPDRTIYTLKDYRKRLASYRQDQDLLDSHRQFPWIPVWDDHEVSDNTYRDGSSFLTNTEDSFQASGGVSVDQRKMNAVRAYFEWMPIRQVDMSDNLRVWRSFSFGSLFDLIMLDTRQYDRSITDLGTNRNYIYEIANDAGRTMMGSRQENWFYESLINSSATWRIIGSQTVFSRLNQSVLFGTEHPFNVDAWDGYKANRNRTFEILHQNNIGNNIMISGDSHANWATDLVWLDEHPYDSKTGKGSMGVEFAGTAVSSSSPAGQKVSIDTANDKSRQLINDNPELQWSELFYRGYYELHISRQAVRAKYFGVNTLLERNSDEVSLANFTVNRGANALARKPSVGGGKVGNGALRFGKTIQANGTQWANMTHLDNTGSASRDDIKV